MLAGYRSDIRGFKGSYHAPHAWRVSYKTIGHLEGNETLEREEAILADVLDGGLGERRTGERGKKEESEGEETRGKIREGEEDAMCRHPRAGIISDALVCIPAATHHPLAEQAVFSAYLRVQQPLHVPSHG